MIGVSILNPEIRAHRLAHNRGLRPPVLERPRPEQVRGAQCEDLLAEMSRCTPRAGRDCRRATPFRFQAHSSS